MISFTALLFSATFRKKIERLARDILVDPIRVVQGDIGEVCIFTRDLQTHQKCFKSNYTKRQIVHCVIKYQNTNIQVKIQVRIQDFKTCELKNV